MFDPYRLYTRHPRRSEKGQVLRKKPSNLTGSVSDKDLPLLRAMAEALGYKLERPVFPPGPIPPGPDPPPPIPYIEKTYLRFQPCHFFHYSPPSGEETFEFTFNFPLLEQFFQVSRQFNIDLSESVQLKSLTVDIFINHFTIQQEMSGYVEISSRTPHGDQVFGNIEPGGVVACHSDNFVQYVNAAFFGGFVQEFPWHPLPPPGTQGMFDRIRFEWTGSDAVRYYYAFKNNDQSILFELPYLHTFFIELVNPLESDSVRYNLMLEFFVTIVTNERI